MDRAKVGNISKKEGVVQLAPSPANCLRLGTYRNPHLEDLVFVRLDSLTIDADYPAVYKLIQLTIFEIIQRTHKITSFLRAIPPVKIKVLSNSDKTINPVLDPGFMPLRERKIRRVTPCVLYNFTAKIMKYNDFPK